MLDEDIKTSDWKVYQRRKKRAPDHPCLWLDDIYFGPVREFRGDPPLDCNFRKDPPLDHIFRGVPSLDRHLRGDLMLDHASIMDH